MVADFDEEPQRGKEVKTEGRRRRYALEELAGSLVNGLGRETPPSLGDICR